MKNAAYKLSVSFLLTKKRHIGTIFRELAKTSDCAHNKIWLAKLNFYGIQGTAANQFRS
jgi:hypothetical protein